MKLLYYNTLTHKYSLRDFAILSLLRTSSTVREIDWVAEKLPRLRAKVNNFLSKYQKMNLYRTSHPKLHIHSV